MADIRIQRGTTQEIEVNAGSYVQCKSGTVYVSTGTNTFGLRVNEIVPIKDDSTVTIVNTGYSTAIIAIEAIASTGTIKPTVPATGVVFGVKPTEPVVVGVNYQLKPTVTPSTANRYSVSYSDSTGNIVTAGGMWHSTKSGTFNVSTTLTNQDGSTVTDIYTGTSSVLTGSMSVVPSMQIGDTYQIISSVLPSGLTGVTYAYSSSDESIATVSSTGLVTAIDLGNFTITQVATYKNVTATNTSISTVEEAPSIVPATGLTIDNLPSEVVANAHYAPLTSTVTPSNASGYTIEYGFAGYVNAGTYWYSTRTGNTSVTCTATLTNDDSSTVTSTKSFIARAYFTYIGALPTTLKAGDTYQVVSTTFPTFTQAETTWTYSSSDPSVATISPSGLITVLKAGTTTISQTGTYKVGATYTATADLTITAAVPATGVVFGVKPNPVVGGITYDLIPTVTPSNASGYTIDYVSSLQVIDFDKVNNKWTPSYAGTENTTVTTTLTNENGSTVTDTWTPIINQFQTQIGTISSSLTIGDTFQIVSTVTPAGLTGVTYTYTSSNPTVATVSSTGLITVKAEGEFFIHQVASYQNITASDDQGVMVGTPTEEIVDLSTVDLDPRVTITETNPGRAIWDGVSDHLSVTNLSSPTVSSREKSYWNTGGNWGRYQSITPTKMIVSQLEPGTYVTNAESDLSYITSTDIFGVSRSMLVVPNDWNLVSTWDSVNNAWLVQNSSTYGQYTRPYTTVWSRLGFRTTGSGTATLKWIYLHNADRSKYLYIAEPTASTNALVASFYYKEHPTDSTKKIISLFNSSNSTSDHAPFTDMSSATRTFRITPNGSWNRYSYTTDAGVVSSARTTSTGSAANLSFLSSTSGLLYSSVRFFNL